MADLCLYIPQLQCKELVRQVINIPFREGNFRGIGFNYLKILPTDCNILPLYAYGSENYLRYPNSINRIFYEEKLIINKGSFLPV